MKCKNDGCNNETRQRDTYYESVCRSCENLTRRYGLTSPERNQMIEAQANKCGICNIILSRGSIDTTETSAVVDHCHSTGKIRGILCNSCNKALGLFKDSPEILDSAIKYLKNAPQ